MYAKKAQPLPNEQPLFEFDFDPRGYASTGTYTPWTEYGDAKKVAMVTSLEKGAYVDIETRDKALLSTVKHLGKVSMLGGLENAIYTPRREELKSRYGSKLSDLMANAEVVRQEAQANARHEFALLMDTHRWLNSLGMRFKLRTILRIPTTSSRISTTVLRAIVPALS